MVRLPPNATAVDLAKHAMHQETSATKIFTFTCPCTAVGPTLITRVRCQWMKVNTLNLRPVPSSVPPANALITNPLAVPTKDMDYVQLGSKTFQLIDTVREVRALL